MSDSDESTGGAAIGTQIWIAPESKSKSPKSPKNSFITAKRSREEIDKEEEEGTSKKVEKGKDKDDDDDDDDDDEEEDRKKARLDDKEGEEEKDDEDVVPVAVSDPDGLILPPRVKGTGRKFQLVRPSGWDMSSTQTSNVPGLLPTVLPSSARSSGQATTNSMQTRHARRIYAGGFEPGLTETEIVSYFTNVVKVGMKEGIVDPGKVVSAYVNSEKSYAFVEFTTIELTNSMLTFENSLNLNGRQIKIKRPNDYKPELLEPSQRIKLDENFNTALVTASSSNSSTSTSTSSSSSTLSSTSSSSNTGSTTTNTNSRDSIHRIFIGGIPREMDENMLRELFQTFGSLKSLSMMRGPDGNSKGFGFCEYNDTSVTDSAIAALNNVTLFNRSITVSRAKKPAVEQTSAVTLPTPSALLAMSQGVVKPSTLPLPSSILTHQFQGDALALQQFNQLSQKKTLTAGIHGPRGDPSTVVCFENMVSADELSIDAEYTDILDDIRDEGSKFGPLRVTVPRPPHPSAGRVFLYYEDISNAIKAAHALSGRKFGPNIVTSKYYPEKEFREGNLTA